MPISSQTPKGRLVGVFLGTRPYKDDFYNIGRETFLLPVRWQDGWPEVTAPGAAVPYVHARPALPRQAAAAVPNSGAFHVRDEFAGKALAPYLGSDQGDRHAVARAVGRCARPRRAAGGDRRGRAAFVSRPAGAAWLGDGGDAGAVRAGA